MGGYEQLPRDRGDGAMRHGGRRVRLFAATLIGAATLFCAAAQAASAITVTSASLNAVEGVAYTGVIGTFTGDSPLFCSNASNYNATVTWGNSSSPLAATVTADPKTSCGFVVSIPGNHARTFPEETATDVANRTYKLQISGPLFSQASGNGTATVDDAALTAGQAQTLSGVEGTAVNGIVATFSDANPGAAASDFAATVDWGDGSAPAPATVTADGGHFDVNANHAYASAGQDTATVTITDAGGKTTSSKPTFDIADAPLTAGKAQSLSGVEGTPISGIVATFTDANTGAAASDFSATVDWGDGSAPTSATVTLDGDHFDVNAGYTYGSPGPFTATVKIVDASGSTASPQVNVDVADAPLSSSAATISAAPGVAFSGAVGGFSDANTGVTADDFIAAIDWGDGSKATPATVAPDASGGPGHFTVSGGHTYASAGSFVVTFLVLDVDGDQGALGTSTATVTAPPTPDSAGGRPPTVFVPATTPPAAPTTSAGSDSRSVPVPKLVISKPRFGSSATVVVILQCPAGGSDCRGDLVLSSLPDRHAKNKRLRHGTPLGSALFILTAGSSERLDIRLSKNMQRLLAHAGTVRARARATSFGPTGSVASVGTVGTLRAR